MQSSVPRLARPAVNSFIPNRFGRGGRSSNSGLTVTVFGATGFVSRYLISELGNSGTRVYAPFRGDELDVRHLKPSFDLGQLGLIPFNARDRESIKDAIRHSDVVVNLIGKSYETKHVVPQRLANGKLSWINYSFDEVHIEIAKTLAEVTKELGVERFVHVSAVSAKTESSSRWSRSKALGEAAVRQVFPDAVVVRLNTVFGPEDRFLNLMAEATKRLPFFPLLHGGVNVVQPVYVGDVAKGLHKLIEDYDEHRGETFDFSGPSDYTYKELAEFVQDVTLLRKPLIDTPASVALTLGRVGDLAMNPFFTEDSVARLSEDVLPNAQLPSLQSVLGESVPLTTVDRLAFDYLHRFRQGGHFALVKGYH